MSEVPGHKGTPEIPGGLPLMAAGCAAADLVFGEGPGFWENLDERVAAFGLDASLDRALAGRSSPRVWVLVHQPGHPQLAVGAALGFARALADRGQAALVIDGDDQATPLSRWAGREDAEGWIDMVRYGTSVLTSGVALPFAGRTAYLLGVGSYAPTDATAAEIEQLLGRLRRQADDLLVVLPGGAQAGIWAQRADIRILCHDQAALTPPRLAAVVANLTAAGVAPTALLGFGQAPGAQAAAPEAGDAAASPDDSDLPDAPDAPDEPADDPAADDQVEAALAALAEDDEADRGPRADAEFARRRGSSGVFWLVAVAATVMIAAVAVYYLKFVRVPDGDVFGERPTAALVDKPAPTPAAAAAVADTAPTLAVAAADSAPQAAAPDTVAAASAPESAPESAQDTAPAVTTPEPVPAEAAPAGPRFDAAVYQVPVGADGWALQVYSFRDSASADEQIRQLKRRGLRAAVRIVELPDSGRWWRVFVGSFPSRRAARAAEAPLFEKLRIDWARPTEFTVAVTDTAGF